MRVSTQIRATGHPRLFLTKAELPALRADRTEPGRGAIWNHIEVSAHRLGSHQPRSRWLPPRSPDPDYENLYDRFYAAMTDVAITEHLAFAAVIGGDPHLDAARSHLLALARTWAPEAGIPPDYGSAYAVSRLLKGVAVGYDLLATALSPGERLEVRSRLETTARWYVTHWYDHADQRGPAAHTHHAHVEWASLGLTALALLGEVADASHWLAMTVEKFEAHLLPRGLAADGAQVEGPSFWASTQQHRLLFMDALRRVTGHDLFAAHGPAMSADMSIAAVAAHRVHPVDQPSATMVLEPASAQLGYHAPVYEGLARFYRRPHLQYLAGWDRLAGSIIDTGMTTPSGERLLFALGPYAYLWHDHTVAAHPTDSRRTFHFPSVATTYLRASWIQGDPLVAVAHGRVVINLGGQVVLGDLEPRDVIDRAASESAGTAIWRQEPQALVETLTDLTECPTTVTGQWQGAESHLTVRVSPSGILIDRVGPQARSWWSARGARLRSQLDIVVPGAPGARIRMLKGALSEFQRGGHRPDVRVGYGSLRTGSRPDDAWPLVRTVPDDAGRLVIEVTPTP